MMEKMQKQQRGGQKLFVDNGGQRRMTYLKSNIHCLQFQLAENDLKMHSTSNIKGDGLQQQVPFTSVKDRKLRLQWAE